MKKNECNIEGEEAILRGLSKSYFKKVICYETTKVIWDELNCIHDKCTQIACAIKNSYLKDVVHKASNKIENHEMK